MKILPIVQLIICCFTQHIVYSSTTEIPIPVYNEAVPIETANSFQYSYVVKLTVQFEGKDQPDICTGSLITRSLVITAGHCVTTEISDGKVLDVEFPPGITPRKVKVKKVFGVYRLLPPLEDFTKGKIIDIAFVELKTPIPICSLKEQHGPRIIKLPVAQVDNAVWKPVPQKFSNCTTLGYGKTAPAGLHQLRKISNTALWHLNNRFIVPLLFPERQGRTCYGDSGGPTICNDVHGEPRLYGVTSFASGQLEGAKWRCHGETSVYVADILTDVQYLLPKLRQLLLERGKLKEVIEDYHLCSENNDTMS
ncbi:unnamed protein product [Enterobius vermicularis]|uniref:Peptidase S1 domain-containing protein n=1 Tax=Enterobius vermicularis TaxID=51028 RepID=A0A0N4V5N9_ENTVE|nr:unnamed protein product [Enterobius vermicularis]